MVVAKVSKSYCIDDFNPCIDCKDYGKNCTGIDGGECEKCQTFLSIKFQFEKQQREIAVTRKFISRNNLEYDLLSFALSND